MTDISRPPLAARQPPYHPAEALSDAEPPAQQVIAMRNAAGDRRAMVHLAPEGSLARQIGLDQVQIGGRVPLTKARSEGTAATRDIQAAHEKGRRP